MPKKILFILGTRPEAIKIAPVYHYFKQAGTFEALIGLTGQHRELARQALEFFKITPDFDLDVMTENQTLNSLMAKIIVGIDRELQQHRPDYIMVQGDTTTVLSASLAAFHLKIPVLHLEAGLRSGDKYSPFPEEMNRALTGGLTAIHLAPTPAAAENLRRENITHEVHTVGNTVIDALHLGLKFVQEPQYQSELSNYFAFLNPEKKTILVTCHRRENFGEGVLNITGAIRDIATKYSDEVTFCIPVHPNPHVKSVFERELADLPNVHLLAPLSYPYLISLMNLSFCILTDSGGIQEEAPSLGKPVLVMREKTERTEGIDSKNAELVGTNRELITQRVDQLITDPAYYASFAINPNPYGDGNSSRLIHEILVRYSAAL
jgi:UDP-N-acetylglucosamine 2-epimerase (non-hydrolysing)